MSVASFNAAYPFGIYTVTASNSATTASQSASLTYSSNNFPSVPTLLSSLQGMNPAALFQVNVTSFGSSGPGSSVALVFLSSNQIESVTASPMSPLVIQPNTLLPNTTYNMAVDFINQQTSVVDGVTETVAFTDPTEGLSFTTGNATPVQVVNGAGFQGERLRIPFN